jgi:TctA family transporter
LKFTAPEYFSLMVLGLAGAVVLAHGAPGKAVAMVLLGLLLGLVGIDVNTGAPRMTLDIPELGDGIGFVPIAIGMFGVAELAVTLGRPQDRTLLDVKIRQLWPSREEIRACIPAMLRGTALGSVLGVLPGGGAALSSFAAYGLEKKVSRTPERFGRGAIEGVAAPEAANNAGAQTSFIPLLTLGIPGNAIMALMIGAMMIQGIQPGPQVMTAQPQLFWGVIASMWLGNVMLVILNLPLIGVWVSLLRVPYRLMFPAIVLFCCIGTYSINNSAFEVGLMLMFAALGVFFIKVGAEPAPFILGFILGPLMEENFRRAMMISRGDLTVFLTRPISGFLLFLSLLLLIILILPAVRSKRAAVFQE